MNIFITGANQGIGYYLAEGLLELGHRVTVLGVETTKLLTLQEKYPGQLLPLVCDVRDTAGMRAAVQKSADTYGAIDIAIHNACLCTFGSMKDTGNPAACQGCCSVYGKGGKRQGDFHKFRRRCNGFSRYQPLRLLKRRRGSPRQMPEP